jgi:glycosyltransferase involved in cell wall biosynthesis
VTNATRFDRSHVGNKFEYLEQDNPEFNDIVVNILFSSLASSPNWGSEAMVGYHVIQALSSRFDTEVVTSAGMQPPQGVKTHTVALKFDNPNDVGAGQLLRYEFRQRRVVERLLRAKPFDILHRATPSGYKDSLLRVPSVRLVVGPVLGSTPPPASFSSIYWPHVPHANSLKSLTGRIEHAVARRVFQRFSTLDRLNENAALILVGTELTRRLLPERLHSRCRYITYTGIEHDLFTPPVRRRSSRIPQLLFVGRLVAYKGVELLLRAAAVALRRCRFELKIVGHGTGPEGAYYHGLAAALRLTEAVTFVDGMRREALADLYRAADIYSMPTIEAYGIAVVEAMSSGCAVLVPDYNGPGEVVQPGRGLKVPLKTPEQFIGEYAERIVQLVEDAKLREALGGTAREYVVEHHDWKRVEASLLEIYDDVFSIRASSGNLEDAGAGL